MDELEALTLALAVEKAEMKFYLEMARKAKEERARRMFLFLAGEEAEHWDIFENNLMKKIAEKCVLPSVNEEFLKNLTPTYEGKLSEVKAVELGMEQEKLTWEFYERAAQESEDEEIKRVFRELAEIEKAHYELLRAQYDSIMKTGIWMDYQDFSLEID